MVAFGFLPQTSGKYWGPMNGTLSFYEARFSGGDTERSWGHANPTCCNRIHLNFLHSEDTQTSSLCPSSICTHTVSVSSDETKGNSNEIDKALINSNFLFI